MKTELTIKLDNAADKAFDTLSPYIDKDMYKLLHAVLRQATCEASSQTILQYFEDGEEAEKVISIDAYINECIEQRR